MKKNIKSIKIVVLPYYFLLELNSYKPLSFICQFAFILS